MALQTIDPETTPVVFEQHALDRMEERHIGLEGVYEVLANYHLSRPTPTVAEKQPVDIYIGSYQRRRLKVYVERDSLPINIRRWPERTES